MYSLEYLPWLDSVSRTLKVGMFFPDGIVDRTDLRAVSRNSPCLGDAASYLTGARVRFGTQDVMNEPGVWYILQKISNLEAVYVYEEKGFFPEEISKIENTLSQLSKDQLPNKLTELKEKQDNWVRNILLSTKPGEHYFAKKLDYKWIDVPYANKGVRSDILFKDVI